LTDNHASQGVTADGRIAIKLQRDKESQFFELPEAWKFTNSQVTAQLAGGALVLTPRHPGKLKLPQAARQASDYPKKSVKKLIK
jgi:virulence-associated protein VagC